MDASEFRQSLADAGLSQAQFRRLIEGLSGQEIGDKTVNRWATGGRATRGGGVPALAVALLKAYTLLPEKLRADLVD